MTSPAFLQRAAKPTGLRLYLSAWYMDCLSPQDFLHHLLDSAQRGGNSYDPYSSAARDSLLNQADSAQTKTKAMPLYLKEERTVLKQTPVVALVFPDQNLLMGPNLYPKTPHIWMRPARECVARTLTRAARPASLPGTGHEGRTPPGRGPTLGRAGAPGATDGRERAEPAGWRAPHGCAAHRLADRPGTAFASVAFYGTSLGGPEGSRASPRISGRAALVAPRANQSHTAQSMPKYVGTP